MATASQAHFGETERKGALHCTREATSSSRYLDNTNYSRVERNARTASKKVNEKGASLLWITFCSIFKFRRGL